MTYIQHFDALIRVYPLNYADGHVVHSYGRLIPHRFPITDLQQISGPDGIGQITCTVSSGTAEFTTTETPQTGRVIETRDGATASLTVNATDVDSFHNIEGHCTERFSFFFVFLSAKSKCSKTICI